MFRIILIFLIFFYFPSKGQDYFFAEGKKVKEKVKTEARYKTKADRYFSRVVRSI